MKQLSRIAFFALAIFVLVSCDKDDPAPSAQIVGKWTPTSIQSKITPSTQALVDYLVGLGYTENDAQILVDELEGTESVDDAGTIEFKSDGTYESIDDSGTETGTWELSSDSKTLTIDKGTSSEETATVNKADGTTLELDFDYTSDLGLPTSSGVEYHLIVSLKKA